MSAGRFCVLGGGAWGTALAMVAARAGYDTVLWARDGETVRAINRERWNPRYLPGIPVDDGVAATCDLESALTGAATVLAAVPAQTLRGVLEQAALHIAGKRHRRARRQGHRAHIRQAVVGCAGRGRAGAEGGRAFGPQLRH